PVLGGERRAFRLGGNDLHAFHLADSALSGPDRAQNSERSIASFGGRAGWRSANRHPRCPIPSLAPNSGGALELSPAIQRWGRQISGSLGGTAEARCGCVPLVETPRT